MQAPEMRTMSVLVLRVIHILHPFLKLTVFADFVRGDLLPKAGKSSGEFSVLFENTSSFNCVGQQVANNLMIHRGSHNHTALFGGIGRSTDQLAGLRIFNQVIREEQACVLHGGIGACAEEILIAGEKIMFPQMLAQPRASRHPGAMSGRVDRRGAAPEIGIMMEHPAMGTVVGLGSLAAALCAFLNEFKKRVGAFREVGNLRWPVVP